MGSRRTRHGFTVRRILRSQWRRRCWGARARVPHRRVRARRRTRAVVGFLRIRGSACSIPPSAHSTNSLKARLRSFPEADPLLLGDPSEDLDQQRPRPKRSSAQTTMTSNSPRWAASIIASNSGRALAALTCSSNEAAWRSRRTRSARLMSARWLSSVAPPCLRGGRPPLASLLPPRRGTTSPSLMALTYFFGRISA